LSLGLLCKVNLEKNSSTVSKATALIKIFAKLSKIGTQHQNDIKSESQYKLHKAVTSVKETEKCKINPLEFFLIIFRFFNFDSSNTISSFSMSFKDSVTSSKFHCFQLPCS